MIEELRITPADFNLRQARRRAARRLEFLADDRTTVPMVGASGAIAGVLGAYLLLYPMPVFTFSSES